MLAGLGQTASCIVVKLFDERWCQVIDRLVRALGVEPVNPFESVDLDVIAVAPRAVGIDQLGLVEVDLRLGQGIAVSVAHGSDRWVNAGTGRAV